jgi:hypothetical protein
MTESTLTKQKLPIPSGLDLDPTLYHSLVREYEFEWRNSGDFSMLKESGIYCVLIYTGDKYIFEPILQKINSDDLEILASTMTKMDVHAEYELRILRPAIRFSLQGQQHTYHFYVRASTVQEAMDNFQIARVMCS